MLPGIFGTLLYGINNLGVFHAAFSSKAGYLPFGLPRNNDVAQYLTWIAGLQRGWLLPNYHAALNTSPALFVPAIYPIAIARRLLPVDAITAFRIFDLIAYVCTAYALAFAYRTFCRNRVESLCAFTAALICVPVASLPGLSRFLYQIPHGALVFGGTQGFQEFSYDISDAFLHGLVTWPSITYGVCLQVVAMALLARFCDSHQRRWLVWLAGVCFISALLHPFEIFVTLATAVITLVRMSGGPTRVLARLAALVVPAGAGLFPHVLQSYRFDWLREAGSVNLNLANMQPLKLLSAVGLPALVALLLLLFGLPKKSDGKTAVLKAWFVATFLVFYIPVMPWQYHLLDGIFFCIGLLLTTQLKELLTRVQLPLSKPTIWFVATTALVWMLSPHFFFRVQAWKDAVDPSEIRFMKFDPAMAPANEPRIIAWLRENASSTDLVLTTQSEAPWVATVPIRSFASHWLFSAQTASSIDRKTRNLFFAGELSSEKAQGFLENLHARFVVVPNDSLATRYLENARLRVRFDSFSIYELPGTAYPRPELTASNTALLFGDGDGFQSGVDARVATNLVPTTSVNRLSRFTQ